MKHALAMAGLLAGLVLPLAPADAQTSGSPSFSCARARTFAERTICADPELARLDRIVADLNTQSRSLQLNAQQLETSAAEQRAWLAKRNRCAAKECLRQSYFSRIATLADELPPGED